MDQAGLGLAIPSVRLAGRSGDRQTGNLHSLASCRIPSALAVEVAATGPPRVTAHPTAEWTLQQFRETLPGDHPYKFLIHDRDAIFSANLDHQLTSFGVRVLKSPVRCPQANAFCERLIGTIRRECLDFLIPLSESHLRHILLEWMIHYNRGRPHSSLGPGIPEPPQAKVPARGHRHRLPTDYRVATRPVVGELHHEYAWEKQAA